MTGSGVHGLIK